MNSEAFMNKNANLLEELRIISGVTPAKCMQCGRCSAACPAADAMDIHPHRFAACLKNGDTETLLSCEAKWECLSCFSCNQRCPRDVKPASILEAARQVVLRMQNGDRFQADEAPCLPDNKMPQQLLVSAFRKLRK